MKYKILPGGELFDKIHKVNDRAKVASKAARHWIKENLPESNGRYIQTRQSFAGGILAVSFDQKPEGWVVYDKNTKMYSPKSKSKIWQQWTELPKVQDKEIKDLIQYGNYTGFGGGGLRMSTFPGMVISKEFILIEVAEYATQYAPVEGMVEITVSEFNSLKSSIEKATDNP